MTDQFALVPTYLFAHLELTLVALAIGATVSIPLGIAVTRYRYLQPAVIGLSSVIQTIPSLALLAIMVPLLAVVGSLTSESFGFSLRSIGYLPAVTALTLYSTLPILANTVTGIEGVNPAVIEAARASGMTPNQRLRRVELPLAMPTIVTGLRTSAIWVVGTATLSTSVGATSLGNFIFSGLQTRNFTAVSIGCVSAALLALCLDQLIRLLERGLIQRRKLTVRFAIGALFALVSATIIFQCDPGISHGRTLRVGAKTFTEQYILSSLVAGWIEQSGRDFPEQVTSLGSTVAFDALRNNEIDLYVDYSGTIWATVMNMDQVLSRKRVLEHVRSFLQKTYGVVVVAVLGFENTYALGMRANYAQEMGVRSLSDLALISPQLEIGGDIEFFARAEWRALRTRYGFRFGKQRSMESALMYQAVASKEVDVISAFSTDGRINAYGLVLLEDDLQVIPPYDAILLASPRFAKEEGVLLNSLRALDGRIDGIRMRNANFAVDQDGQSPKSVASKLLRDLFPKP